MQITRDGTGKSRIGTTFSGEATLTSLVTEQTPGGIKLSLVEFKDGAVTNWHTHPGEQILYILNGKGRVGDETEAWEVGPGDVIHIAAGENHWHGAAEGHDMSHLSLTNIGSPDWSNENPFS